jgi:hypothetical protein
MNILQNTNMEKFFAWRFDDNIAANHSLPFVGRAEFGMKKPQKKNLFESVASRRFVWSS